MVDLDNNIDQIRKYQNDKTDGFRYDVLIINNSTLTPAVIQNMIDFSVPIFSVNQAIFDELKLLDIKTEVANYITYIKYKPSTGDALGLFTTITSFVLTAVLSTLIFFRSV